MDNHLSLSLTMLHFNGSQLRKMEGLLTQWALAIQEYEFTIYYCRGHGNGNADALSRKVHPDVQLIVATSQAPVLTADLHEQHLSDPVIQELTQPSL